MLFRGEGWTLGRTARLSQVALPRRQGDRRTVSLRSCSRKFLPGAKDTRRSMRSCALKPRIKLDFPRESGGLF